MAACLFHDGRSGRIVARRRGQDVSAAAFHDRIGEWCAELEGAGNAAIAIFNADGVEFAAALLGALHAGKTVYLPGDTLASTCRLLHARGVAFVGSFPSEWRPITQPVGAHGMRELGSLDMDTAQLVIFTSGTTGLPQALAKRMSQLVSEVHTLESMFGARLGDCDVLATVSHQHIYGLLFKILWPLIAQRPFVSESMELPEEIVAHLGSRRAAVVSGPAQLKRLPANLGWAAIHSHVAAVFSSGGPLPLAASASVEAMLHCAPIEIYGSSETGGVAWRQRMGGMEQPWTPLDGVRVRDADGRLAVRSSHLPDDEWHVVEDGITMETTGAFVLHGRTDRIAKIEGKRVPLAGIENALTGSELVADARVVVLASKDVSSRDELGCIVVPSEAGWDFLRVGGGGTRAFRGALETLLRGSIERIAIPRRWRWLDTLPVNASGKTTGEAVARIFAPMSVTQPAAHALQITPHHARFELYVSPQLDCLDGHFARVAVLPGAAQLDWAVTLGQRCFGMAGSFTRLKEVKFHRVYTPGPLLSLELDWAAGPEALSFRFSSSQGLHSSGRMYFGS